jgi:hypothetical protein
MVEAYLSYSEDLVRFLPEKQHPHEEFVDGIRIDARAERIGVSPATTSTAPRRQNRGPLLVVECRQGLQHFRGPRPMDYRIVFADFTVTENQNAFGELRDVVLVGYQNNR